MLRNQSDNNLPALKPHLDELNDRVENSGFIHSDPVQFMHAFDEKRDREIAGFLSALMAWGRREIVCRKIEELLHRMDFQPVQFVNNYTPAMSGAFRGFKHRTFKPSDIHGFISALRQIYLNYDDFELFWKECRTIALQENLTLTGVFHRRFLGLTEELEPRTRKHLSDTDRGSPAKRICMFLRWTLRKESPVDPGIWNFMPPAGLHVPFDVHVARQSRRLGLLTRKSNDWRSVTLLTEKLRLLDPSDPSRYDFALFGLGALGFSVPQKFILNP